MQADPHPEPRPLGWLKWCLVIAALAAAAVLTVAGGLLVIVFSTPTWYADVRVPSDAEVAAVVSELERELTRLDAERSADPDGDGTMVLELDEARLRALAASLSQAGDRLPETVEELRVAIDDGHLRAGLRLDFDSASVVLTGRVETRVDADGRLRVEVDDLAIGRLPVTAAVRFACEAWAEFERREGRDPLVIPGPDGVLLRIDPGRGRRRIVATAVTEDALRVTVRVASK